ncbi:MAG: sensor histidine kinase, partial [Bacteroidota bacterium]
ALISAQKAQELLTKVGGPPERASANLNYSQTLMNTGQLAKASFYLATAKSTINEFGLWQAKDNLYRAYGKYYAALGNIDSVEYYLDAFADAKDREADTLRIGEVAKLEVQFQSREQQAEIERLALEDKLNQAKLRRQRTVIGGGLVVVGLLGSLLWWIFTQRRRIGAQNVVIRQALKDKDVLLKEIHHRVKNNLQLVSTLLSLQSEFVEERAALDALQMGKSRVRSMALIHQKLYLGEAVSTQVDAKDYLERLVHDVVDTHRIPDTSIGVTTKIEELTLDIDTIIPLGLIANEAVTNAVKYAYRNREQGELYVALQHTSKGCQLTIRDDGPGLTEEVLTEENGAFGQLLMQTLSEQLEGELLVNNTDNGVEVLLRFPMVT